MFRLRSAMHEGFARIPACVSSHFLQMSEIISSAHVPRPHAPKARSAFLIIYMFLCLWMRIGKNKLTIMIWTSPFHCSGATTNYLWCRRWHPISPSAQCNVAKPFYILNIEGSVVDDNLICLTKGKLQNLPYL